MFDERDSLNFEMEIFHQGCQEISAFQVGDSVMKEPVIKDNTKDEGERPKRD